METHMLDAALWNACLGKPRFFRRSDTFSLLAFCVDADERLPKAGYARHGGAEAFVLLSGELSIGTRSGLHDIRAGSVTIIEAAEDHYTLNRSGKKATLVSFGLP